MNLQATLNRAIALQRKSLFPHIQGEGVLDKLELDGWGSLFGSVEMIFIKLKKELIIEATRDGEKIYLFFYPNRKALEATKKLYQALKDIEIDVSTSCRIPEDFHNKKLEKKIIEFLDT